MMIDGQHIGRIFVSFVSRGAESHFHHKSFGRLDPRNIDRGFWNGLSGPDLACLMEVDEPRLGLGFDRELGPYLTATAVLKAAKVAARAVFDSGGCQAFLQQEQQRRLERSASELRQRQSNAISRAKVSWRGKDLMCVPRGEQEVVSLLGKLETLNALPVARFCLREYTPKAGIDALVDYQVDPTGQSVALGPVELEYSFANFFQHRHPIQQVGMIVCWEREGGEEEEGRLQAVRPGLFRFTDGENSAWLVVLSEIDGLEVV